MVKNRRKSGGGRGRQKKSVVVNTSRRMSVIFVVVLLVFVGIVARLWWLQVIGGDEARAQAEEQYAMSREIEPNRGTIFAQDKSGLYPLAINKNYHELFIVPKDISAEKRDAVVRVLLENLGDRPKVTEEIIRAKLAKENDPYEIIARQVDDEIAQKIFAAVDDSGDKLPGIASRTSPYRYYPAGEIASQTIGFVGSNGQKSVGRYGIEASFEEILRGTPGIIKQARDAGGRWISTTDREMYLATDGADVVLTIDYSVQFEVEKILAQAVEKNDADGGSVIVMRPNGTILAMASQPRFDPNNYRKVEDIGVFVNPAVSHNYEAGSVMKAVTAAIGLDSGKIRPDSTYVDTGVVNEAGYAIRNSEDKVYGLQTMTQALEQSINTGMIHIQRLVGNKLFGEYLRKFGFGQKSGIELPSEASGNLRNLRPPYSTIAFYTASFGQGISVTPLQLARAYSVIANGGMLMKPRIIAQIIRSDKVDEFQPEEVHRVISAEAAAKTREMLESVVINGHGRRTAVPGYRVGGKTGTAQVAKTGARGYDDSITIGSFAGIAPIDDPQFVVVAKIDNPKGVIWAESTAGPVFQKTMKFLLEYYGIPPTESRE